MGDGMGGRALLAEMMAEKFGLPGWAEEAKRRRNVEARIAWLAETAFDAPASPSVPGEE